MAQALKKAQFADGGGMRLPAVLVVDDDDRIRDTLRIVLGSNYETIMSKDANEAISVVKSRPVDVVLMDIALPDMDGISALEKIKAIDSGIEVIMLTGTNSAQAAITSLRIGAYDYITKPFDNIELLATLKRCTENLDLRSEVAYLKDELGKDAVCGEIISRSPKMRAIFDLIGKVAKTSSSVFISGESGTGKELVARAIQSFGDRKDRPFVAFNCGAVPSELMESELFGHERGAFTGAIAKKIGKFEYADGGTVFLDEVSTLPMHLQIKLLRVLQEKTFERIGSNIPVKVDIRVIAATNTDIEDAVRKGLFREDLYYRLKVVPIALPPLRERKEDIPVLVSHFIKKNCKKCNKTIRGITADALKTLNNYSWPGNVRELENFVERLIVVAKDDSVITADDLPVGMFYPGPDVDPVSVGDLKEATRFFERHYIMGVLNKTGWNRAEAARMMKIHRNTLLMKMKTLGIKET